MVRCVNDHRIRGEAAGLERLEYFTQHPIKGLDSTVVCRAGAHDLCHRRIGDAAIVPPPCVMRMLARWDWNVRWQDPRRVVVVQDRRADIWCVRQHPSNGHRERALIAVASKPINLGDRRFRDAAIVNLIGAAART